MNEYVLATDKFERPQIKSGNDAIYTLMVRLLLLVPGTSQTHPEMGVGLIEKYRYMDMNNLPELQNAITTQIAKYLPNLNAVTVTVEQVSSLDIKISVKVNTTLYLFNTDFDNNTIKLSEL